MLTSNVPVKDGVITNDSLRITAALPTIKYILEQGGRAIPFFSPWTCEEEADKERWKSLAPVAADLAAKLGQRRCFPSRCYSWCWIGNSGNALEDGPVLLV